MALNRVAQRVADVAQQVPAVGDLDRFPPGAPWAAPSAKAPARSRATTSIPGCARSQVASVWACRSGSRSTTRLRSRSTSTVP